MDPVKMMRKAIKDHKGNKDYKWTADCSGLTWSYGASFSFEWNGHDMASFTDDQTGDVTCSFVVDKDNGWLVDEHHDFVRIPDEAIYWAARKMMERAEYIY